MLFQAEGRLGNSLQSSIWRGGGKAFVGGKGFGQHDSRVSCSFCGRSALQPPGNPPSEKAAFVIRLPYREEGLEDISDLDYLSAYTIASTNLGYVSLLLLPCSKVPRVCKYYLI